MSEAKNKPSPPPTVQVASCTVSQLLSNKGELFDEIGGEATHKLAIPEYQRPYRWDKRQITRLLDDIAAHDVREGARLAQLIKEKKPTVRVPYYLGSVILHRDDKGSLNIIDGQQRITSLALLAQVAESGLSCDLIYRSPLSQQRIVKNWQWLEGLSTTAKDGIKQLCFDQLEFTLVVTDSEDDAYAFFETQNTGGVRLSGPDIIKAHHLRAVDKDTVNAFALQWEGLGDLSPVVDALLRGRYWRGMGPRDYPRHNRPTEIRTHIVSELAELTGKGGDTAYGRVTRTRQPDGGESVHRAIVGYELRQPLNSGANTIHYLRYFDELRLKYLAGPMPVSAAKDSFHHFYHELVCKLGGCSYLKQLFDACLLMYISQFGEQRLYHAAVKMFRVVYSRRVENRTAVRELSVSSFVREVAVLDWIALSYTPAQCLALFDGFELKVSQDGLDAKSNGVKKCFVLAVNEHFELNLAEPSKESKDPSGDFARDFGEQFSEKVSAL